MYIYSFTQFHTQVLVYHYFKQSFVGKKETLIFAQQTNAQLLSYILTKFYSNDNNGDVKYYAGDFVFTAMNLKSSLFTINKH